PPGASLISRVVLPSFEPYSMVTLDSFTVVTIPVTDGPVTRTSDASAAPSLSAAAEIDASDPFGTADSSPGLPSMTTLASGFRFPPRPAGPLRPFPDGVPVRAAASTAPTAPPSLIPGAPSGFGLSGFGLVGSTGFSGFGLSGVSVVGLTGFSPAG